MIYSYFYDVEIVEILQVIIIQEHIFLKDIEYLMENSFEFVYLFILDLVR